MNSVAARCGMACGNEKLKATEAFSAEDWLLKPQYIRRVN